MSEEIEKKSKKSYYKTIDERLKDARLAIEGALGSPEILEALGEFGYDGATIETGKQLLESATDLVNQYKTKYGEKFEATAEIQDAVEVANKAYMKALTVARIAFKKEKKADNVLGLSGSREQSFSAWLPMVRGFYENLLGNSDWIKKMERFKFGKEKLEADFALVKSVMDLEVKQTQKKGEAQASTKERDAKLDELNEWMSDFKDIAFMALDEQPQLLEKLGYLVRG